MSCKNVNDDSSQQLQFQATPNIGLIPVALARPRAWIASPEAKGYGQGRRFQPQGHIVLNVGPAVDLPIFSFVFPTRASKKNAHPQRTLRNTGYRHFARRRKASAARSMMPRGARTPLHHAVTTKWVRLARLSKFWYPTDDHAF